MITLVVELLLGLGSKVRLAAARVLVLGPPTLGVTTRVKLVALPPGMGPTLAITVSPRLTQPGDAETKVTPAGKVLVSVTLTAGAGPRLVTVRV